MGQIEMNGRKKSRVFFFFSSIESVFFIQLKYFNYTLFFYSYSSCHLQLSKSVFYHPKETKHNLELGNRTLKDWKTEDLRVEIKK